MATLTDSPSPVDSNGERWVCSHGPMTLPTKIIRLTTLALSPRSPSASFSFPCGCASKGNMGQSANSRPKSTCSYCSHHELTTGITPQWEPSLRKSVSWNLIISKGPNRDEYLNPCHWNVMITTWFPSWGTDSDIKWSPCSGGHTLCDPLPLS